MCENRSPIREKSVSSGLGVLRQVSLTAIGGKAVRGFLNHAGETGPARFQASPFSKRPALLQCAEIGLAFFDEDAGCFAMLRRDEGHRLQRFYNFN